MVEITMKKKTAIKNVCLILVIACFTAAPALAVTRIVDQNGNGDYTSIQACSSAAQEGDTCEVRNGSYSSFSPRSGRSYVAASGHSPVITSGLNVEGASNVTIRGFEIRGGISSSPYSGSACSNVKIVNNYINGASIGVNIKGNDILISGNTFENMSNDMIRHFGDRWIIRNNTVINESDSGDVHMDFWQSFCSGSSSGVSSQYGLIENNSMINVSGGNVHFALVNGTSGCGDPPRNLIFRYNKIHNIGSLGVYIDNNSQASGATKNVVYNNTFSRLSNGSFSWENASCVLNASTNSSAINNLHDTAMKQSSAQGFYFGSGGSQSYNLYYSSSGTMSFSGAASNETGAVKNENPLLSNPGGDNFSLKANSPAINKGGPLTRVASSDSSSGKTLIVEKAEFFQPGWAGAAPDTIAVGSVTNIARISSINYNTNTITLATSISRSDGDPVYLYKDSDGTRVLYGSKPDIGAVETTDDSDATVDREIPNNLRFQ
jgi:hypothetical protein